MCVQRRMLYVQSREVSLRMKKHYVVPMTKSNTDALVNRVKRVAQKIRDKKSLSLSDIAVALAVTFRVTLKKALDVESFFKLVNEKTQFFSHPSSSYVFTFNKNAKNKKKMTDVRYAVYQCTVALYDKMSQFAADVLCFDVTCDISEAAHSSSKKLTHRLLDLQTSKAVDHVCKMSSLKDDISVISRYVSKRS